MKLFEHPDFEQAIIRAAEHFRSQGLRESIIEKDYFVTETLRIIEQVAGGKVIFKGGTSLSKGWNLIQRFSEDIDIFFDPTAFAPALGKKAIDRELKKLRDAIECHPALTFVEHESQTIGGFGRNDRFEYIQRFIGTGDIRNRVFVEAGTASGREPTNRIQLQSYVGQFLQETGVSLGAEDEGPFKMRLLHFRRTFVEKMFAIHAKVEAFKQTGKPIGGYARHYYDLFCLAERPEVLAMLRSDEYLIIKADYDRISTKHFSKNYVPPPDMTFAKSSALFPSAELRAALGSEFEAQCQVLCFGPFPSWDSVQTRFEEIRALL
ncbi:MAG: nucleotidyl transferase AbiEii/AbiGii toxin family protein [Planctomycetes bacterium]|nr:nucleotidyl transferase AbiEii/AbiGii toxin family protein [Planctomycetota bacterium]